MEYNLHFLGCGFNATGCSSMLSLEQAKRYTAETSVENRVLVNVGDSTQRLCSEHRIKLSKVSTIILNSLAPHNVSGFAGVFLSLSDLGTGEVAVYGPTGTKSLLDSMIPFINRKFPILKIIEVEEEINSVALLGSHHKDCSAILDLLPIFPTAVSSS
jgi:ribonuclease BN (tRNA processing enzyme)